MPIKGGRKTPNERVFAQAMADTGDKIYAAAKAGYAVPASGASQALQRPAVQAEIRALQLAKLNGPLADKALKVLETVLDDPKETTRNRLTAAKIVIDRTFGQGGEAGDDKEPHEMTPGELQARIDRLRREQAERAAPVLEHEPQDEADQAGVFD